ncbi:ketose-bisphosphate aldolase [Populibacterium corticicola]|uniref:Ketose-bisphosphate aldolase n=1 Tax=Populibacterium corticicola TaxID=1812826 RepID=A0ABW5XEF8_9MICO
MLTQGTQLLDVANSHNFAVPAFNISDYAMFKGVMEISEELDAPVIIAIHPDEYSHVGRAFMYAVRQRAYESSVPVTIHWDHGADHDQFLTAAQVGFTSMMIDASLEEFDRNVEITSQVVRSAHVLGIPVEGELGTIGKLDEEAEQGASEIIYTRPEDAVRFVELTQVDSLAIAIGTSHGLYPSSLRPELKQELLSQIKEALRIPLVLHGGSNNPDEEIAEAVRRGVNKINISSDIKAAYHQRMREVLADPKVREPNTIQPASLDAMKEVAAHKIDLFQAAGKAKLY